MINYEEEDDSMDSDEKDDDETVENDSESDSSDPWENLRAEVRDALSPSYVKQVERFMSYAKFFLSFFKFFSHQSHSLEDGLHDYIALPLAVLKS